ncbi:hypothetical protein ECKG_05038 [Escherichia coli TA206]|nr:hypothetical protein ECKG_05038 [Escherichia coli TA206]
MDKVSREYSNKTILEYTPDLIIDKNKAISQKNTQATHYLNIITLKIVMVMK